MRVRIRLPRASLVFVPRPSFDTSGCDRSGIFFGIAIPPPLSNPVQKSQPTSMKNLRTLLLITALAAQTAFAGGGLGFQAGDSTKSVLERQTGQQVELRLKSGEKITGKVEKVGDKAVHLAALAGMEYYEAMVLLDEVSAIIVRAASK